MEYRNIVHFYKNLYINLGLDLLPIEIINFLKKSQIECHAQPNREQ